MHPKKAPLIILILLYSTIISAQNTHNTSSTAKTKAVFGFGFPELAHAGFSFDVTPHNQVGLSAGFLPLPLEAVIGINLKTTAFRRVWFCRQSFSYISDREKGGIAAITFGKDFGKTAERGWTADAGIQVPTRKESSDRTFYAAIRIQYFIYFRKKTSS
jgi:hypothetical protein